MQSVPLVRVEGGAKRHMKRLVSTLVLWHIVFINLLLLVVRFQHVDRLPWLLFIVSVVVRLNLMWLLPVFDDNSDLFKCINTAFTYVVW